MNGPDFLTNAKLKIKPENEYVEISVFGRGFGECIVLCCGNQEFIIIDSFLNPNTQNPIALDYLNAMGIESDAIKKVVLTHWHADHITGVAEILKVANPNVQLVVSPIISQQKFNEYINLGIQQKNHSTTEFEKIYAFLKEKGRKHICFAKEKTRIYANENCSNAEVYCLFPHDGDMLKYLNSIILPKPGTPIACEYQDENLLSLVLLMKYSSEGALFGGDLEVSKDNDDGWDAIVNNFEHTKNKPSLFKIPHHGSENAHCDAVWENLLKPYPISILTVFNKGFKLPKDTDIERIISLSGCLYIIGDKSKEDKNFERQLRKTMPTAKVSSIPQEIGLVRYRKNRFELQQSPIIETFGAVQIMNNQNLMDKLSSNP